MNTLIQQKTLRCSRIGVALSFLLLPIASPASNGVNIAQTVEITGTMNTPMNEVIFYFEASLTDGARLSFPFSEQPTLRNQGKDLVLTTTKETVNLPHGSVDKFTIVKKDGATGIHENQVQGEVKRANDVFYFSGCQAGSRIQVFDGTGKLVTTVTVAQDGTADVSLQLLPTGVYVIKSASVNLKYLKK